MFSKEYCSKNSKMVKNGLTIILLTGWHKNELSVLECALSVTSEPSVWGENITKMSEIQIVTLKTNRGFSIFQGVRSLSQTFQFLIMTPPLIVLIATKTLYFLDISLIRYINDSFVRFMNLWL